MNKNKYQILFKENKKGGWEKNWELVKLNGPNKLLRVYQKNTKSEHWSVWVDLFKLIRLS